MTKKVCFSRRQASVELRKVDSMRNSVEQKIEAARAANQDAAEQRLEAARKTIQEAADKYPGDHFTREKAAAFMGVGAGHLANLDSKGDGPDGSFYLGRRRVYPKQPFVLWLQQRVKVEPSSSVAD